MIGSRFTLSLCTTLAIGALAPGAATAHQTLSDAGATVTLHVNPDDEPVAGKPATIG